LPPERVVGVETGGCPHTAIREDASANLEAVYELQARFPGLELLLIESGGDNLAATFSPELVDASIYVIDVAEGEKIPRKGGPGTTRSPLPINAPCALALQLNATGGLVGGDRLSIDVGVAAGAHAVLTTPSATRVYRTEGEETIQSVRLAIGPRAVVEWVPDHTIPFAGSALRQTIDVELDETAGLVLVDAFSAGRIALGEAWQFSVLDSA